MKNAKTLSCLFLFFSLSTSLFSQDGGFLNFACTVISKDSKPVKGVTVKLFQNNEQVTELTTKKNGQFTFNIYFDGEYKIAFSCPGYLDMYLIILASEAKGNIFPQYDAEITLHSKSEKGIDLSKYKEPFLKLIFDGQDKFIVDREYADKFKGSTPATEDKVGESKTTPPDYSKSNYPEKFAFADTNKDNAISMQEANAFLKEASGDKKELANELIDWLLE